MLRGAGEVNVLGRQYVDRVLDTRPQVVGLKVGVIIAGNLIKPTPFADQFQDALHGDARPRNARFTEVDFGIDGDSILHPRSLAHRGVN